MIDLLLGRLARMAGRRAKAGEHWGWIVIAVAAWLLRRARRAPDPLVTSVKVSPGDRLLVALHGAMPAAESVSGDGRPAAATR